MLGSIWAEYYGTNNLGAIRSLVIAFTVAASALGPGVTGWLIDVDIDIETQCVAMAVYLVVVSAIFISSSDVPPKFCVMQANG